MGRVNALFMEQQERLMAEWLEAHPGATEEEAYYAIHDDYELTPRCEGKEMREP